MTQFEAIAASLIDGTPVKMLYMYNRNRSNYIRLSIWAD